VRQTKDATIAQPVRPDRRTAVRDITRLAQLRWRRGDIVARSTDGLTRGDDLLRYNNASAALRVDLTPVSRHG